MDLNSEVVGIADLRLDDLNPRRIAPQELAKLRRSLQEFGMVQPIVARRSDQLVIGGHQRLQAAIAEGWSEVPVIWWEGSDKQARALNLALNKISGQWDEAKLATVLSELADVESLSDALLGFETTWTSLAGFDTREVLAALDNELGSGQNVEDLAALAANLLGQRPEPKAQPGDLFALGPHRLLCGDARDEAAVTRLCQASAPSLLFCDPPYGVSYSAETVGKRKASSGRTTGRVRRPLGQIVEDDLEPPEHLSLITAALKNAVAVLSVGSGVYVCGGTSTTSVYDTAFKEAGLVKSSIIIWDKGEFSLGRKDYQSQFELIYYGWPRGGAHRFFGGRAQADIWLIPRDATASYVHPTQKPVALAERAMRNSTLGGEAVLDLFGGSGSTLIAAERCGRKALLLELDPRYIETTIARWEAYTGLHAQLLEESVRA